MRAPLPSIALTLTLAGCGGAPMMPGPSDVTYPATPIAWPAEVECGEKPAIAKEVMVPRTRSVVVAAGADPISDAEWVDYSPSLLRVKNSTRHLLFSDSCFWRSPGTPADCAGESCRTITEFDGHTWMDMSQIIGMSCVGGDDCDPQAVAPGDLAVVVTAKCHRITFTGEAFLLRGPGGEQAVMHATPDGQPTTDVPLPPGWTLTREALPEPLVLLPFGAGDDCYYNIIRDARGQSYHQFGYAGPTWP